MEKKEEEEEMKKKKKKKRKNGSRLDVDVRQSLAWNAAFFTEQGVLNENELSRLASSSRNKPPCSKLNHTTLNKGNLPKPSGLRMPSPSLKYFAQSEASSTKSAAHSSRMLPHKGVNSTTTSHPSIKLNPKFKTNLVQASPLLNSIFQISGDASNQNQHQEVPQSLRHQNHFTQHQPHHIPQVNSGRLVHQSSPADGTNDSKNNNSSKNINSDGELNYELEKASQSNTNWKLQKYAQLGNLINTCIENEEFNTSELEILQVPLLVNLENQNNAVSGADHLIQHKNDEVLPLQESLTNIPLVDTDKRMLVVDNDCIEAGNDGSTLLAEQEQLKKLILDVVDNVRDEEKHCPPKDNCGPTEQDDTFSKSLENIHPINLGCKGLKSYISPKHTKISHLSHCKISGGENMCEFETSEFPPEDKGATIALIQKSLGSSSQDSLVSKHKLNPVPFSDEWLAALEEVGEEILTKKTGAVQNSPPDKSLPEPGPWSPVKRKNVAEIGPFDCTKYTNQLGHNLNS